ncbi:non-hydrolyzing UDP-N-acetylglucosamine 2-epimerase [Mycetocola saprophilus]|uniref:non-hydrolyzing UDP-N-acetylglucosamine 2-epimerase n=1 Tax=Mycetocola saprophilus TaxID=76636 RepID=UPI003BF27FB7
MKTLGIVLGTRPEVVKLAPLIMALHQDSRFALRIISTGQQAAMLDQTLEEFGVAPDVDFAIMIPGQSLTQITHRALEKFAAESVLAGLDALVVHGDTATTLAGALAAFQAEIPLIHVEAGLRSGDPTSPYPEEGNRKLVAQVASLHLAPTRGNLANLIREGVREENIVVTGNTVVDALNWGSKRLGGYGDPLLSDLDDDPRRVIVASAHHRVSHGTPMREIAAALGELATRTDIRIVISVHPNPAVQDVLVPALSGFENVDMVAPLPYLAFCRLLRRSHLILSDSSGAEEEGPALGIPTLVLRRVTERHESLGTGSSRLVGVSRTQIVAEVERLLDNPEEHARMARAAFPYGDGHAAQRSVVAIGTFFGLEEPEEEP